jgi:hypothetical protein
LTSTTPWAAIGPGSMKVNASSERTMDLMADLE